MIKRLIQKALARIGYVVMKAGTYEQLVAMAAHNVALERDLVWLNNTVLRANAGRTPPRKIAFLHIGKTAGSSLNLLLKNTLSERSCIHLGPWEYDELSAEQLDEHDLILGHFSYHHILKCRTQPFLLTFFRDPVDRVVSNYYFLRSWTGYVNDTNRIEVEAGRTLTLRQFIGDPRPEIQRIVRNQQTYSLGADWRDVRVMADYDAVLANALTALDSFSFVGTTDAYERGVRLLFRILGVEIADVTEKVNVTPGRPTLADVDREDVEAIRSFNQLDAKMFEVAKRRFSALEKACS